MSRRLIRFRRGCGRGGDDAGKREEREVERIPRQLRRFLGGANNGIRYLIYEHKISDLFLNNLHTLLVVIFVLSRPYF